MSEYIASALISRRTLLRRGAVAAAAAAGLPLTAWATRATAVEATERPRRTGIANVRVSHDHYGVHIEPFVAANPRHPGQLLAACQASHTANPQFIATYLSFDAGASWRNGGLPRPPAGKPPAGDDVTVAFDRRGRGYVCASATGDSDADRAIYAWRTDDGGRTFLAPVTLLAGGQYYDHPGIAAGAGRTPFERNVYVVWASNGNEGGDSVALRRSTDGGQSFEPPRTILDAHIPSNESTGPKIAAGAHGVVCVVGDAQSRWHSSGDMLAQAMAVCSRDAGHTFAAPVKLGWESLNMRLPGDVIANAGVTVAAAPNHDALYVAFNRRHPVTDHADIVVRTSYDRGRTWSRPVTATPHDSVTYFQPNLAVDEAGRVAISAFALANGRIDEVLFLSPPHHLHFGPPLRVTTAPFDPHSPTATGRKHGAWWIGDYQGISASAGAFHLVWNDTRTGKLDLFAATVRP
jgi:hypothetical protein